MKTLDDQPKGQPYVNPLRNGNAIDIIGLLKGQNLYIKQGQEWDEDSMENLVYCIGEKMPIITIPCLNIETGQRFQMNLEYMWMDSLKDLPVIMINFIPEP